MTAPVAEVFSSIQGEGLWVGVRQIFVRTYGCDLACRYCDTPAARTQDGPCRVELPPGSRRWRGLDNPLAPADVDLLIDDLDVPLGTHHSVSLTGGEPLLHLEFVAGLAARCRKRDLRVYLETNGQRVDDLRRVLDDIDIVAMDVKLPSSQTDRAGPEEALLDRSMEFLSVARSREAFVKIVCTAETTAGEIAAVAERIAAEAIDCPVVLQPVTPAATVTETPSVRKILALQAAAHQSLGDVRVIPQCHIAMGLL